MDTETANKILQKNREKQQKKNEREKLRRQALGDEWKKRNMELQQAYRDREKNKLEEARAKQEAEIKKQVKKEVKKEVKKQVKKTEEKPVVKIVKDTGKIISNYERTGIKGLTEDTTKTYITRIRIVNKLLSNIVYVIDK